MTFDWRQRSAAEIEAHFNPRIAVPAALDLMAGQSAKSAETRASLSGQIDLRYGADEKQTFDLFPATNSVLGDPPPAQIFIHGGYWRAFDKSDHSVCAGEIVHHGASHISLNYDLCPSVSLDRIVEQIFEAIQYIRQNAASLNIDPARLFLCGHSAGAHLAAMMLSQDWGGNCPIKGIVAVSGIYDPEPVLQITTNDEIGLDLATAQNNNVLTRTVTATPPVFIAAGGAEPEGWRQQSLDFADYCVGSGINCRYLEVPGANHFTIVEEFSNPAAPLFQQMLKQISDP
jgi:arylformamidase